MIKNHIEVTCVILNKRIMENMFNQIKIYSTFHKFTHVLTYYISVRFVSIRTVIFSNLQVTFLL
jgi:hypothetical protein